MKYYQLLLFAALLVVFNSCEPPDDDNDLTGQFSDIHLERSLSGGFKLNDTSLETTIYNTMSPNNITDIVNKSNLPGENYTSAEVSILIPIDSSVSIESREITGEYWTNLLDTGAIEFQSYSLGERSIFPDGIERQEYIYNFNLSNSFPTLNSNNLLQIFIKINFQYRDNNTNETIETVDINYILEVLL